MIQLRWIALRLEFVGSLIIFFSSFFVVLQRNNLTPGIIGLTVSYSLTVTATLNWMVRSFTDFESSITSVERIKEYIELPHEAEWEINDKKPEKDWPKGNLKFVNFVFSFKQVALFVLKNLNLEIKCGEKVFAIYIFKS